MTLTKSTTFVTQYWTTKFLFHFQGQTFSLPKWLTTENCQRVIQTAPNRSVIMTLFASTFRIAKLFQCQLLKFANFDNLLLIIICCFLVGGEVI